MGYPVTYRTSEARAVRAAQRGLPSFQGANDNRPGTIRRLPSRSLSPRYNFLKFGQVRPPRNPFGLAQRQANQRALIGAFRGGLRFRQRLLSAVGRFALHHLMDYAYNVWTTRNNPGMAKHPGWLVDVRWGTFPFCSGKTAAHTTGALVFHGSPPLVFGHPWGGVPFDWAEYDAVDQVAISSWRFLQVGRGDQGTGPNPAAFYAGMAQPQQALNLPQPNPWKEPYNPSWNRMPGRWPQNMPRPMELPLPWFDPFLWPPYMPTPVPFPVPYWAIPYRRPNPWRSPHEQSQWGPMWVRRPVVEPVPPFGWPDIIDPPKVPKPDPWPDYGPDWAYPPKMRDRFEPKLRTRTRITTRDRRPPRATKEKKIKAVALAAQGILAVVNSISEFSDFLRALYKALPKKYQRRNALVMDQWRAVYEHFDELDLPHAIRSVARDQVEDFLYGSLGRVEGKAANRRGGLYDPSGRAIRKLQDPEINGKTFDPIDYILDRVFGKDT